MSRSTIRRRIHRRRAGVISVKEYVVGEIVQFTVTAADRTKESGILITNRDIILLFV